MTLAEEDQALLMEIYNNVVRNENGQFPKRPTPPLSSSHNIFSEFREERDHLRQELVILTFLLCRCLCIRILFVKL